MTSNNYNFKTYLYAIGGIFVLKSYLRKLIFILIWCFSQQISIVVFIPGKFVYTQHFQICGKLIIYFYSILMNFVILMFWLLIKI